MPKFLTPNFFCKLFFPLDSHLINSAKILERILNQLIESNFHFTPRVANAKYVHVLTIKRLAGVSRGHLIDIFLSIAERRGWNRRGVQEEVRSRWALRAQQRERLEGDRRDALMQLGYFENLFLVIAQVAVVAVMQCLRRCREEICASDWGPNLCEIYGKFCLVTISKKFPLNSHYSTSARSRRLRRSSCRSREPCYRLNWAEIPRTARYGQKCRSISSSSCRALGNSDSLDPTRSCRSSAWKRTPKRHRNCKSSRRLGKEKFKSTSVGFRSAFGAYFVHRARRFRQI